jgi:hypothetical protein
MKIETIGSAAAGSFGVAGAWLAQLGLSLPAVVFALIGAALAALELENRRPRTVVALIVFNVLVASLGAPLAAGELASRYELQHPTVVLLLAFGIAYIAHDAFVFLRALVKARMSKRLGGAK